MSEQQVKVTLKPDDEIVVLQQWYELVESDEFNKTVLTAIDKRLAVLKREKSEHMKKLMGMDMLVLSGQIDARADELTKLKDLFALKVRKYQRKLKGE